MDRGLTHRHLLERHRVCVYRALDGRDPLSGDTVDTFVGATYGAEHTGDAIRVTTQVRRPNKALPHITLRNPEECDGLSGRLHSIGIWVGWHKVLADRLTYLPDVRILCRNIEHLVD